MRTGLGMVRGHAARSIAAWSRSTGVRLAVRVGIHTGLVVVGEMGGGGRQEQLGPGGDAQYGGPPPGPGGARYGRHQCGHLAPRAGVFYLPRRWGPQPLKGVATPVQVYQVLGESGVQSRLDVAAARGLTPLVGREREVALLRSAGRRSRTAGARSCC